MAPAWRSGSGSGGTAHRVDLAGEQPGANRHRVRHADEQGFGDVVRRHVIEGREVEARHGAEPALQLGPAERSAEPVEQADAPARLDAGPAGQLRPPAGAPERLGQLARPRARRPRRDRPAGRRQAARWRRSRARPNGAGTARKREPRQSWGRGGAGAGSGAGRALRSAWLGSGTNTGGAARARSSCVRQVGDPVDLDSGDREPDPGAVAADPAGVISFVARPRPVRMVIWSRS